MPDASHKPTEMKMLPGAPAPSEPAAPPARPAEMATAHAPARQLSELSDEELEHLAEEYGLDSSDFRARAHLVTAIHQRRQLIASMDRDAMLDVIRWARRPIIFNAVKEQLAREICRVRSMKFARLSQRGLVVLAQLRGITLTNGADVPLLIRKLRKQEGLFARLNRKRRAMLGSIVANMIGGEAADAHYLPPAQNPSQGIGASTAPSGPASIKDEIEESGLFGGIAGRIKKSADSYVNQKLDEIESRIDRKLDEIDRRLAEWRDKEIANRVRILKITLWASVIVGVMSLLYSYIKVYFVSH